MIIHACGKYQFVCFRFENFIVMESKSFDNFLVDLRNSIYLPQVESL